jgi:hypothetical protein
MEFVRKDSRKLPESERRPENQVEKIDRNQGTTAELLCRDNLTRLPPQMVPQKTSFQPPSPITVPLTQDSKSCQGLQITGIRPFIFWGCIPRPLGDA